MKNSLLKQKREKIHKKEPIAVENKLVVVKDDMVEIPKAIISYKLDRESFKEFDDVELLNYCYIVLNNNFSPSSELYESLKEKNMISRMYTTYQIIDNILEIGIGIESNSIHEVVDIVKDKMKKLDITNDDLTRKRRVNIANLINQYDNIEEVNSEIIYYLVRFNKIYDNLFAIYNEANVDKAEQFISRLNLENESIVVLEK